MNNCERRDRVRHQIQLRLDTLRGWSCNGLPPGQEVPSSLNRVRLWEDAELGISKIGSPATCSTTHPQHGAAVKAIADLLEGLLKRQRETRPREPSLATKLQDERRRSAALKKGFEACADQHAAMTVELDETSRDLRVTRQHLDSEKARNAELREELWELRRRLARHSDSELVTDINARRTS